MFEELAHRLQEAPEIIYGVALAPFLWIGAVLIVVLAVRRRGLSRRDPEATFGIGLELAAGAIAASPLFAMIYAWQAVVTKSVAALSTAEPSEKATLLAASISTQMNADAFLALQTGLTTTIAAVGLGLLVAQRMKSRLAGAGAFAMMLSLPVLAVGVLVRVTSLISTFGAVAMADPAEKALLLKAGIEASRGPLLAGATAAGGFLALGVLLLIIALVKRQHSASGPSPALAVMAVALMTSIGLLIEARPFATENAMPIPFSAGTEQIPVRPEVTLPSIEGPDALERAPIVTVQPKVMDIEGIEVADPSDLADKLSELRRVQQMMNPGSSASGRLILAVDERASVARLVETIAAVSSAEYRHIDLALVERGEPVVRPLLGTRTELRTSATKIVVEDQAADETVTAPAAETFGRVVQRLVDARRRGSTVRLAVE